MGKKALNTREGRIALIIMTLRKADNTHGNVPIHDFEAAARKIADKAERPMVTIGFFRRHPDILEAYRNQNVAKEQHTKDMRTITIGHGTTDSEGRRTGHFAPGYVQTGPNSEDRFYTPTAFAKERHRIADAARVAEPVQAKRIDEEVRLYTQFFDTIMGAFRALGQYATIEHLDKLQKAYGDPIAKEHPAGQGASGVARVLDDIQKELMIEVHEPDIRKLLSLRQ